METIKNIWRNKLEPILMGIFLVVGGLWFFYFIILCILSMISEATTGQTIDVMKLVSPF